MRETSDSCPHCHAPAPTEPVSTTRFRAWLLCLSCGHVWTLSRLTLVFRSCSHRRRVAPVTPAQNEAALLTTAPVPHDPAGRESDPALESWLASMDPGTPGGSTWKSVDSWLDSDPLPVALTVRDGALEDEWGIARRPGPAHPAPRTLLERLDALYQGMLQLERFVEKSARMEEAALAAAAPVAAPTAAPRPRPRLVPRPGASAAA